MTRLFNKIRTGLPCLLVMLMLFSSYPYIFYCFISIPSGDVMILLFLSVFLIYSLLHGFNSINKIPYIGVLMLIQIITWVFFFLFHSDTTYLTRVVLLIETYLALMVLTSKGHLLHFTSVYNWSLTIQGALGLIAFFLYFAGLISPIAIYYFSDTRYEQCFLLTCSNTVAANFMRVGGYFDEPGALAFWGVFALVINKLIYDNKKVELVLLFSLLFTFSAAYFLILPVYLLLFYYNRIKRLFLILLLAVPLLYVGYQLVSENESVAIYVVERFAGGEIESTRFEQAKIAKELFKQSPILGNGAKKISDNHRDAEENPYEILAKDGAVGLFITYLPLLFLAIHYRRDRYTIFSILILSIDYLQRPFHVNQMQFFMLYFFCSIVILNNKSINRSLYLYESK